MLAKSKICKNLELQLFNELCGRQVGDIYDLYEMTVFVENINDVKSILESEGIALSKDIHIGLTAGASTIKSELEQLKTTLETMIEEV